LNKNGVFKAFNSITHSDFKQSRKRGDIVEQKDKQYIITEPNPNPFTYVPKPSSIIIVDKGKSLTKEEEKNQLLLQIFSNYLKGTSPIISFSKYIELFNELKKDIPVSVVKSVEGLKL